MDMAHLLPWLLAYGHLVIIASAAIAFGLTATRSYPTMTDADELRRRSKQKQGGHIFNEMLSEMKARKKRTVKKIAERLAQEGVPESERTLAAEFMTICLNELDDIEHMLDMKEPD